MKNLRTMRHVAALALSVSLLGGCVSASKYKALESDNQAKGQDLDQARARTADLDKQLEVKKGELKTAGDKLEDLNKQLGAKDQELTKAQGKLDELAKRIEEGDKKLKQALQDGEEAKKAKGLLSARYQDQIAQSLDFLTLTKASLDKRIEELALLRKNSAAGAEVKEKTEDTLPAARKAKNSEPAPEVKAKDEALKIEPPPAPESPKTKPAPKKASADDSQL